jgi:hypothetical protein
MVSVCDSLSLLPFTVFSSAPTIDVNISSSEITVQPDHLKPFMMICHNIFSKSLKNNEQIINGDIFA